MNAAARDAAFAAIAHEVARLKIADIADLFTLDQRRADAFTFAAPHLTLDLSKQRLDAPALAALEALAHAADFDGARRARRWRWRWSPGW